MKRQDFDQWVPNGSPLRTLASKISTLPVAADPTFFGRVSSHDWPYNFLANGQESSQWCHPPTPFSAPGLAAWKAATPRGGLGIHEEHGFDGSPPLFLPRGLSLLFDPLVDSFLAAHLLSAQNLNIGNTATGCTVIVLSDYYQFGNGSGFVVTGDWGLDETCAVLGGNIAGGDRTTRNLFDCLFGRGRWKGDNENIVNDIVAQRVLLWNFLPMFRGGTSATASNGVPPASRHWVKTCWNFLAEFVHAVQAANVVLACSRDHLRIQRSGVALPSTSITVRNLGTMTLPGCVRSVWRLNHPYSWGVGNCPNECALLQSII